MSSKPQDFYWDWKERNFYIVNHQEECYLKIDESSPHFELLYNLYCSKWKYRDSNIEANYRLVSKVEHLSGSEYWHL